MTATASVIARTAPMTGQDTVDAAGRPNDAAVCSMTGMLATVPDGRRRR